MSTCVDDFISYVAPYCDGLPRAIARVVIRRVITEFFTRTLAWQEHTSELVTLPGLSVHRIPIPHGTSVVRFLQVFFDGRPLQSQSVSMLNTLVRDLDWRVTRGVPRYYVALSDGGVELVPCPDKRGVLSAVVAVAPRRDADEYPDFVFERWEKPIVYGVLADVKQMQGQPWSNPAEAMTYQTLYAAEVRGALVEADRTEGRNTGRVLPPRIL